MKSTEKEKAYLAGYFDGEGTFSITKRRSKKAKLGFDLQPFISVTSTKRAIIDYLCKKIGKGFAYWTPRKGNANDAFAFHLTGTKSIIWFIEQLEKDLVLKKKIAQKLKEYCLLRKDKMRLPREKRGYTEKELKILDEIRLLNKRGKK